MTEVSLEMIQRMVQKVLDSQGTIVDALNDLKTRVTSMEAQAAALHGDFAGQSARMDKIEVRLARIERRLELAEV